MFLLFTSVFTTQQGCPV